MAVFLIQGCTTDSDEKYDLKSPCVSADQDGAKANPCQKRRPVNQGIS